MCRGTFDFTYCQFHFYELLFTVTKFRHGSELSSSSKTRVFVSGFRSSKKFEVRTKVREPEIFDFL